MKTLKLPCLLLFSAAIASSALADSTVSRPLRTSLSATAVRRVVIEIPVGEITVRNSAGKVLNLVGTVSRDYDEPEEVAREREILDATQIEIYVNGSVAVVRERLGGAARSFRAKRDKSQLELEIGIPPGVELEVRQSVGSLDVNGSFNGVDINLSVGEIMFTTPKKRVSELTANSSVGEVSTNIGDRVVTKEGLFAGKTHYLNEGGLAPVKITVKVGEIKVHLTP